VQSSGNTKDKIASLQACRKEEIGKKRRNICQTI
jgi:hypothetical protein